MTRTLHDSHARLSPDLSPEVLRQEAVRTGGHEGRSDIGWVHGGKGGGGGSDFHGCGTRLPDEEGRQRWRLSHRKGRLNPCKRILSFWGKAFSELVLLGMAAEGGLRMPASVSRECPPGRRDASLSSFLVEYLGNAQA